jgi:hypothetical protein
MESRSIQLEADNMLRILARVAAVGTFAVLGALPMTASAAGGGGGGSNNLMTIVVGSPISLHNRLLIVVPVTVTCVDTIAIDPNTQPPGGVGVIVEEANRTTVSHGMGGVSLFSCSPTPQTFAIQVTPDIAPSPSPPFHRGRAILLASGGMCDFNFPQTCDSGSTPWLSVKLG